MKSLLFPQFKTNPLTGWQIQLPKLGQVQINLHRPIPDGFVIKQVRVVKKAVGWFAVVAIDASFGQLRTILEYVGRKRDVFVGRVDHKGTSQTCPNCRSQVRRAPGSGSRNRVPASARSEQNCQIDIMSVMNAVMVLEYQ
jgi:transposase